MNLDSLNKLTLKRRKHIDDMRSTLEKAESKIDEAMDASVILSKVVSEVGDKDLPILVEREEFLLERDKEIYDEMMVNLARWKQDMEHRDETLQSLKNAKGKVQAAGSHGREGLEDFIKLRELLAQLSLDTEQFYNTDVVVETALYAMQYIIAADQNASDEILGLIGADRIKEWINVNG